MQKISPKKVIFLKIAKKIMRDSWQGMVRALFNDENFKNRFVIHNSNFLFVWRVVGGGVGEVVSHSRINNSDYMYRGHFHPKFVLVFINKIPCVK